MELSEDLKCKSAAELEEWFLGALESEKLPFKELMLVLQKLASGEEVDEARSCAEFLQDALTERGAKKEALVLLHLRHAFSEDGMAFRKQCKKALRATFKDRLGLAYLKNAGFDKHLDTNECLRRMDILNGLADGVLCYDKTWGFGVVKRLDDFYEKVTIDFVRKPRHQLSFAYAAETLALIGDSHLEAQRYRDPKGFIDRVENNPAEIVKSAILSYRPMSAPELQILLEGDFIEAGTWKRFWEKARKALKADPLVEMPLRRNDAITLLSAEKDYDAGWLEAFRTERDMRRLLELLAELLDATGKSGLSEAQQEAVVDRLAFIAKGAQGNQPGLAAQAVLSALRLGLGAGNAQLAETTLYLLDDAVFLDASSQLPARYVEEFISMVWTQKGEDAPSFVLGLLTKMDLSVANLALIHAGREGHVDECCEALRASIRSFTPAISLVLWVCRNLYGELDWQVVPLMDLLIVAIECLERPENGDRLRSQNQLRALFEQSEWLSSVLEPLVYVQRLGIMNKIADSRAWDTSGKRSMLARFIRLYPELQEAVASDSRKNDEPKARRLFTSWRTYRERQAQLQHLVEVEIPENSKEIGIARSYGDLRENFEYQAAKDHQRILMQRQREWEAGLKEVKGSDFVGFPAESAGIATSVVLEFPSGQTKVFNVLGEWDGDEALSVISCGSQVAKALEGHVAGDEIELPVETGVQSCRVTRVDRLPDEVLEWVSGAH